MTRFFGKGKKLPQNRTKKGNTTKTNSEDLGSYAEIDSIYLQPSTYQAGVNPTNLNSAEILTLIRKKQNSFNSGFSSGQNDVLLKFSSLLENDFSKILFEVRDQSARKDLMKFWLENKSLNDSAVIVNHYLKVTSLKLDEALLFIEIIEDKFSEDNKNNSNQVQTSSLYRQILKYKNVCDDLEINSDEGSDYSEEERKSSDNEEEQKILRKKQGRKISEPNLEKYYIKSLKAWLSNERTRENIQQIPYKELDRSEEENIFSFINNVQNSLPIAKNQILEIWFLEPKNFDFIFRNQTERNFGKNNLNEQEKSVSELMNNFFFTSIDEEQKVNIIKNYVRNYSQDLESQNLDAEMLMLRRSFNLINSINKDNINAKTSILDVWYEKNSEKIQTKTTEELNYLIGNFPEFEKKILLEKISQTLSRSENYQPETNIQISGNLKNYSKFMNPNVLPNKNI
jgi:hypothetical protein